MEQTDQEVDLQLIPDAWLKKAPFTGHYYVALLPIKELAKPPRYPLKAYWSYQMQVTTQLPSQGQQRVILSTKGST